MYVTSFSPTKLRNIRKRAQLTREQVEEFTGVTIQTIYNWERGKRKPQTATLERVLNLYAIRIKKFENLEQIWGEDGLQGRSLQSIRVAAGTGADGKGNRQESIAGAGRPGLSGHVGNGAKRPWEVGSTETKKEQHR